MKNTNGEVLMQDLDAKLDLILEQSEQRFNGIDQRFEKLEGKVDNVDKKVDGLDRKVDSLDGKVNNLERKFDNLEIKVENLGRRVDEGGVLIEDLDGKLDLVLEGHEAFNSRFDGVDQRIDGLEENMDYKFGVVFEELSTIRMGLDKKADKEEFLLLEKRVLRSA